MSSNLFFELDGVSVPIQANLDFDQKYERVEAATLLRMSDGTGVKQTAWSGKIKTVLSGVGWVPAGLYGLDYSQSMLLKCAAARSIVSASNVITVPAERRSDTGFEVTGYAVVGGEYVESAVNVVTNTATVATVAGATHYGVNYYPEITVYASEPSTEGDLSGANYTWSLEAEQL